MRIARWKWKFFKMINLAKRHKIQVLYGTKQSQDIILEL
jgi:hypothetical protein